MVEHDSGMVDKEAHEIGILAKLDEDFGKAAGPVALVRAALLDPALQALLNSTFKREMHRPSADHVWHMPALQPLPSPPLGAPRLEPLEEHDTSYLAASPRILSFSRRSIYTPALLYTNIIISAQKSK